MEGVFGMENVLEVKNIEKYYGNKSNLTKAIDNISFNVQKGEFVGIMGASGSRENNTIKLYFNNRQSYSRKNNS
jgi:ABC-type dipeptide/oligopeptide/nickel transport system ATPase subunit